MTAAIGLLPLMPDEKLHIHVPGRPRSYRALAFHLFRVVTAFLDAEQGATLVQAAFREEAGRRRRHGVGRSLWCLGPGAFPQLVGPWRHRRDAHAGDLLRRAEPA